MRGKLQCLRGVIFSKNVEIFKKRAKNSVFFDENFRLFARKLENFKGNFRLRCRKAPQAKKFLIFYHFKIILEVIFY